MMVRLALRNLTAHRLRLLFTVVAVVLGVAFVSGTLVFRDTSARSFDSLLDARADAPEVAVQPKSGFTAEDAPPALIPDSVLTTLQQKVTLAQGFFAAVEGYAAVVKSDGTVVGGSEVAHRGRAFVERTGSASTMRVTSGRAPTAATDVVVEEHTAAEGGIKVGDTVTVVTRGAEQKMPVVGIFTLGEDENLGDVVTYVGFAPDVAEKLLTAPGKHSAIWVRPRADVPQQQFVDQITAALPAGYEVITQQEQADQAREQITAAFDLIGRFLLAFAAISVLVGSFIIFNTFVMLVTQRTRELALLRAIGASRGQVTRGILGEAVGVGFVGSTLGILAGVGLAVVLRLLFEQFTNTALPARAPVLQPGTIIASYAVGMLVTVIAAYLPARRASRIPPVAALREDLNPPRRGLVLRSVFGTLLLLAGLLGVVFGVAERGEEGTALVAVGGILLVLAALMLSPVLSRPVIKLLGWPFARLGAAGRIGTENARRNPRRTAATAAALMVGLALVSLATVVAGSMSASTDRRLDREFGADYSVEPRGLTGFSQAVVDNVAAVPGVRSVVPVQNGTVRVGGEESAVVVAEPDALAVPVNLKINAGTADVGKDELLVQQSTADERKWTVGSTVEIQYPDLATATARVAGIFADNQVINRPYVMSPAGYRAHTDSTMVQRAFVDLDDADLASAGAAVRTALQAYPNVQLRDRQQEKADARADIDQSLNVILVLLVLSIAVAAVGILNTLGLSIIERTREIGLLRAVGMDRGQAKTMIRAESVVIAVFGALLGTALGVGLGWAVQRVLATDGIEVLRVPVGRLSLYLLAAVLIGVFAAAWPATRAARMNILRAIHHD